MTEEKVKVMFRWEKSPYLPAPLAVFPYEIANNNYNCTCYCSRTAHSSCCWEYVLNHTRPATEDEYAALKKQLENIGYEIEVIERRNAMLWQKTMDEFRERYKR